MPLPTGMRLGPYEILVPLGAGGMGEVYRARDRRRCCRRSIVLNWFEELERRVPAEKN